MFNHNRAMAAAALSVALAAAAGAARADPCKAIPDTGPVPASLSPGRTFSGPVVRVLDGDSMCVAVGSGPGSWVEVRLVDFYAPELHSPDGSRAKASLERIALGKIAICTAGPQSYDRVVSACRISGSRVGDLMRASGVAEGGRGLTSRAEPTQRPRPRPTEPATFATTTSFRSCAEARAAGAAPIYRGQPGYAPRLDRDGDGVACEPYRGR
jgi:endonuclease YncB( thermonuclease family)